MTASRLAGADQSDRADLRKTDGRWSWRLAMGSQVRGRRTPAAHWCSLTDSEASARDRTLHARVRIGKAVVPRLCQHVTYRLGLDRVVDRQARAVGVEAEGAPDSRACMFDQEGLALGSLPLAADAER
jgi:hypothetical protein